MKILFLTDNFPPEVNAPAVRTFEHCKEWVKLGASVTVVTCAPNFPKGEVFPGYQNRFWQEEQMEGIRVVRVWTYMARNEGVFKRTLDYISYAFMAFWAALFIPCDVILATSPQFLTACTGAALSFAKRKKWIMEVRDLWPESIVTVNAMKPNAVIRFLEKVEIFLYRHADKIVVVTESFKKKISDRGIPADKIMLVTNGSNLGFFKSGPKNQDLLKSMGLENKFLVGYIGTHGMAHALDYILRAISKIADPRVHFLFVGDGAGKKRIVELAQELGLKNATFLDLVPRERIVSYYLTLDAVLVNLRKAKAFEKVLPSKIFEAAATHKPILLGVEGEAKELIEKYGAGLCFEPENEKDFLAKIDQVKNSPDLCAKMALGCERLAQDFDRGNLARDMFKAIEALAGEP